MSDKNEETESDSEELIEARSQRRVMMVLWVSIVVVIVFVGILLYAKYHGLLKSPNQNQNTPFPPGPPISMSSEVTCL